MSLVDQKKLFLSLCWAACPAYRVTQRSLSLSKCPASKPQILNLEF